MILTLLNEKSLIHIMKCEIIMQKVEQETSNALNGDAEKEDSYYRGPISSFLNGNLLNTSNYNIKKTSTDCPSNSYRKLKPVSLPIGLIPRIETSKKHLNFLSTTFDLAYIMLNLDVVKRLTDKGLTAREIYPYGNIITTSTIHDSILCNFTVENEIEVITKFKPAWHIPCDYPTYYEDCDEGREWFIDAAVKDTMSFIEAVKDTSIEVIPLVKGINEREWRKSILPFKEIGINYFAFYVKQYFGSNNGKNDQLMVEHVRRLVQSCNPNYLILIGYQSASKVRDLPPEVRAFAGERWIRESKVRYLSSEQARVEYLNWKRQFEEQAAVRQTVLNFEDEIFSKEAY